MLFGDYAGLAEAVGAVRAGWLAESPEPVRQRAISDVADRSHRLGSDLPLPEPWRHGIRVQAVTGPFGRLLWASPVLPGTMHDTKAVHTYECLSAAGAEAASGGQQVVNVARARPATSVSSP